MIRLVLGDDGGSRVDLAGRAFGRGAWVHPRAGLPRARGPRRRRRRASRTTVTTDAAELVAQLQAQPRIGASRRSSPRRARAGNAAAGSDVARDAFDAGQRGARRGRRGRAAPRAQAAFVAGAQAAGKAVAWGTKERLGRATGDRTPRSSQFWIEGSPPLSCARRLSLRLPAPDARGASDAALSWRFDEQSCACTKLPVIWAWTTRRSSRCSRRSVSPTSAIT